MHLATVHSHFWERIVAKCYNILLISNSLSSDTAHSHHFRSLSQTPSRLLVLPHNSGIISLPFSSRYLHSKTHLLSVKLQGFVVGDCGHDLVGFMGLIWWVLVVTRWRFWWVMGFVVAVGIRVRLGCGGGVQICKLWVALMVVLGD